MDVDHITPRAEGGGDDASNLRVTHSECNRNRFDTRRPDPRSSTPKPTYQLFTIRLDDETRQGLLAQCKANRRILTGHIEHVIHCFSAGYYEMAERGTVRLGRKQAETVLTVIDALAAIRKALDHVPTYSPWSIYTSPVDSAQQSIREQLATFDEGEAIERALTEKLEH